MKYGEYEDGTDVDLSVIPNLGGLFTGGNRRICYFYK